MAKILVVDDSDIIRKQVCNLVSGLGYTVLDAIDGSKALDMVKSGEDIDLIISDYNMPGLNGIELVQKVRQEKFGNRTVIMLTTEAGTELKKKGTEVGIRAWLVKPVDESLLSKILTKLLPLAA